VLAAALLLTRYLAVDRVRERKQSGRHPIPTKRALVMADLLLVDSVYGLVQRTQVPPIAFHWRKQILKHVDIDMQKKAWRHLLVGTLFTEYMPPLI
jgi:hypothetical protein